MPQSIRTVTDIVSDLQEKKEAKIAKLYTDRRKDEKETKEPAVKAIYGEKAKKAYELERNTPRLMTGTIIDEMMGEGNLGKGLKVGSSMLIYGEFGSGKSEIAMTMAVLCPDIVIYIDTENSFTWSRIKQICDAREIAFEPMFNKIVLYQPEDWIEQMMLLEGMLTPIDVGKIGLIIIDSLTKLFRGIEFAGRGELHSKQPCIREYPISLVKTARAYGCAMIYTSQIYQKPASNPFLPDWANETCVGGPSLQHQATYVIHLRRAQGVTRIARLIDADDMPLAERVYMITVKGVEDLPDTSKAKEILDKAEKYEQNQIKFLETKSKKKILDEGEQPQENEEEPQVEG